MDNGSDMQTHNSELSKFKIDRLRYFWLGLPAVTRPAQTLAGFQSIHFKVYKSPRRVLHCWCLARLGVLQGTLLLKPLIIF